MKFKDLLERPTDDLRRSVNELGRELWKARFDNHTNQLDDTSKIPRLRRDIARLKTLVTQRQKAGK